MTGSDIDLENAQKTLNDVYDKYIKIYGHICEDSTLKKLFSNDSSYPLLSSLEEYDIQAIREQVDNYYQRSDMNHIEQDWQQYKIDYQR